MAPAFVYWQLVGGPMPCLKVGAGRYAMPTACCGDYYRGAVRSCLGSTLACVVGRGTSLCLSRDSSCGSGGGRRTNLAGDFRRHCLSLSLLCSLSLPAPTVHHCTCRRARCHCLSYSATMTIVQSRAQLVALTPLLGGLLLNAIRKSLGAAWLLVGPTPCHIV